MPEPQWIPTVDDSKLAEGGRRIVYPKGVSILLIRKKGEVFALRNRCRHMGCTLGGAVLNEYTIQCTCHDWRFDIRTGKFLDATELSIHTYETRVEGGKISIKLDGGD